MVSPILLTPEEAANRLHMCVKVLRRLRQQGQIRYVALTERKIRYRPEDCDAFIEERTRKAEPCPRTAPKPTQKRRHGNIVPFSQRR